MCNNQANQANCLEKILKVIVLLQNNAEEKEERFEGCDKPFLGNIRKCGNKFNTRPVTFYTPDGNKFAVGDGQDVSSVFRVESVSDGCCQLRILKTNHEANDRFHKYIGTDEFVTINLSCVCAIKCLDDAILECL